MGNSGREKRMPGEAPAELPAGPRDPSARACARADQAGNACDMVAEVLHNKLLLQVRLTLRYKLQNLIPCLDATW